MSTIWFDVTSTYAWNRPAVGVIRVETECAKYALTVKDTDVKFCRFVQGRGYLEVARTDVKAMLDKLSISTHRKNAAKAANIVPSAHIGGRALRLAAILRKLTGLLPRTLGDRLFLYLARRKQSILTLVEAARKLKQAVKLWFSPATIATTPIIRNEAAVAGEIPFGAGDVYVTLGLDWDQKDLPFIAKVKRAKGFKAVFCCYDLIPVKLPHLCVGDVASKFARYFCDLAWCADEVVSISECSKRDLVSLLQELGAPVPINTVITLGSDIKSVLHSDISSTVLNMTAEKYILYVSTVERRKNHEALYKAYTWLLDHGFENLPKLVFVGMRGWGVNDFLADISFDHRVKDRIVILSDIPDEDLAWLYRNALFTVFPSLYEGWGLGVAESLAHGKMCLASDAGSLREVGQGLVDFIDPLDILKWAERLRWYIENPDALAKAEARIAAEYVAPKWKDTAEQVFDRARGLLKE